MGTFTVTGTGGIIEGNLGAANVNVNLDQCNSFSETGYKMNSTSYFTSNFDDVTIMFWATRDDLTDTTSDRLFTANGGNDLRIYLQSDVLRFRHTFADDSVSEACQFNLTNEINNNDWFHIAAVYDGSGGIDKLFLNGVQKASVSVSKNLKALSSATDAWSIARRVSTTAESYAGKIADCKIYSTALSEAEIKIAASKINKDPTLISSTAPVGYWPIVGTTIDVTDNSSNSNNMTALGTPTVTYDKFSVDVYDGYDGSDATTRTTTDGTFTVTQGKVEGKALTSLCFDGTNDSVGCGTDSSLSLTNNMTFAAWIRPDTVSGEQYIISRGVTDNASSQYSFGLNSQQIRLKKENVGNFDNGTNVVVADVWSHVAVTVSSTDGLTFYHNGVNVGTDSNTTNCNSSSGAFFIGKRWDGSNFFNGDIKDIKVFDYVKSSEGVASLYSNTYPQTPKHYWKLDDSIQGVDTLVAVDSGTGTAANGALDSFVVDSGNAGGGGGSGWQNGTLDLDGTLTIAANGTLSAPRGTLEMEGASSAFTFKNLATNGFIHNNGTVDVDGSTTSNPLIIDDDSVATTKFYNLTISNDHQIRTQNSITVENNYTLGSSTYGHIFEADTLGSKLTFTMGTSTEGGIMTLSDGKLRGANDSQVLAVVGACDTDYTQVNTNPFDFDFDDNGTWELKNLNFNTAITTDGNGLTLRLTGDCEFDAVTVSGGDTLDMNGNRMTTSGLLTIPSASPTGGKMIFNGLLELNGGMDHDGITDGTTANLCDVMINTKGSTNDYPSTLFRTLMINDPTFATNTTSQRFGTKTLIGCGELRSTGGTSSVEDLTIATGGTYNDNNQGGTVEVTGDFTTSGGLIGKSGLDFDGVASKVDCGSDSSIDNIFDSGGTVEAWIKPDSDGEGNDGRVVDKGQFIFNVESESGTTMKIRLYQYFDGMDASFVTDDRVITKDKWNHVAVTYDNGATTNTPKIYVDGKQVAVTNTLSTTGTRNSDASSNLIIGNSAAETKTFDGVIDMVRLFNDIRTESEIRSNMFSQLASSEGGLVAQYVFDEGTGGNGDTTADSSANSNTGTLGPAGNAPNWVGAGTFTKGTSTLNMTGASGELYVGNGGNSFYNLQVAPSGGSTTLQKVSQSQISVDNLLTHNGGTFSSPDNMSINISGSGTVSAGATLPYICYWSSSANVPTSNYQYFIANATDVTFTGNCTFTGYWRTNNQKIIGGAFSHDVRQLVIDSGGTFDLKNTTVNMTGIGSSTSFDETSFNSTILSGNTTIIGHISGSNKTNWKSVAGLNHEIVGNVSNLDFQAGNDLTIVGSVTNCTGVGFRQFHHTLDTQQLLDADEAGDDDLRLTKPALDNALELMTR